MFLSWMLDLSALPRPVCVLFLVIKEEWWILHYTWIKKACINTVYVCVYSSQLHIRRSTILSKSFLFIYLFNCIYFISFFFFFFSGGGGGILYLLKLNTCSQLNSDYVIVANYYAIYQQNGLSLASSHFSLTPNQVKHCIKYYQKS